MIDILEIHFNGKNAKKNIVNIIFRLDVESQIFKLSF